MNWTTTLSSSTAGQLQSQDTIRAVQLSCYTVIIAIGSIGNLFLCGVLSLKKQRKTSEYFILNLAISDLLTCAVGIPLDLAELVLSRWPYGVFLCKVVYPLQTVLIAVSAATLFCMALERYRVILTPLKPKLKGKLLIGVIFITWSLSVLLVSPYIVVLKGSAAECTEGWPGEEYPKAFTMCMFLLLYAIPLCIITAAYTCIIARLHKDSKRISGVIGAVVTSQRGRSLARARFKRNTRVVMVFIFAVVAFALCFLPYHVMWLWHDFGQGARWEHFNATLKFSQTMVYLNSAINPFIFGTLIKRLRSCKVYFKKTVTTHAPLRLASTRDTAHLQFKSRRGAPRQGDSGIRKNAGAFTLAQYSSSV